MGKERMLNTYLETLDPLSDCYGNMTKAVQKHYPNMTSKATCESHGSVIKKSILNHKLIPNTKEIAAEKYPYLKRLNPEYLLDKLTEKVETARRESDQIRAIELLGKTYAMFKDYQQTEDLTTTSKTEEELDKEFRELLKAREEKTI